MKVYRSPLGPGWFIFFRRYDNIGHDELVDGITDITDGDRITKDDNEIIEIITMVMNCDELC